MNHSSDTPNCFLVTRRYKMLCGWVTNCVGLYYVNQLQDKICLRHFVKSQEYIIEPFYNQYE